MNPTKRQIQIVEHFVKKTTKTIMNEANDGSALINSTLKLIKDQIGLDLPLDDYFTGLKTHNGQRYFNVELKQRTSESAEFDKLQKFANKSKLIKVQPNGVRRVSIFLTDKLMSYINK